MNDFELLHKIEDKLKIQFINMEQRKKNEHFSLAKSQCYRTDSIGGVITEVYLNGLELTEIPNEVFKFKNLTRLDCVNNNLTVIPTEITKLKKLNSLYLFLNKITEIPNRVLFLKSLKVLSIHSNPLKNIPHEVFEKRNGDPVKSLISLRDYVSSLSGEETKDLNEVKVILVGDGGSGKTSLQKLLIDEKFDPQESQTHGINIKHLQLSPENKNVTYRLWDFGGQEIMHATHQFFLSRRSIYIIVLNAREEPNPEYWLNHIKSFGGNSPVIIVLNKIDENPSFELNQYFLIEKYSNIIDFVRTSCLKSKGIDLVKLNLKKAVIDAENINVKWALSWFKVKTYLEKMDTNFIDYDQFTELCIDNGIRDNSMQNTLVEYLNDLGIILHFKDFTLHDTHVLDPEWVTYAVYRILNSDMLASNHGILKLSEVRSILKVSEENDRFNYPSSQLNYIIELMMKFELCFKLSQNTILIPDLLEVQEPEFQYSSDEAVTVNISYSFLPKSIMPRLIVNLHTDIKNGMRWRTGLVTYDGNLKSTALIKADYEKQEISITVLGENRRDYLSILLFIVGKINNSFKGVRVKTNIPIDEEQNISVSYDHLLLLESKGIKTYIPDGLDYEIDVKKVLGTVQGTRNFEEEVFSILDKLSSTTDDPESIAEKANEIIQLKPNLFGVGLNINALVKKYINSGEINKKT